MAQNLLEQVLLTNAWKVLNTRGVEAFSPVPGDCAALRAISIAKMTLDSYLRSLSA